MAQTLLGVDAVRINEAHRATLARRLMTELGLSQADLASMLECEQGEFESWLAGGDEPLVIATAAGRLLEWSLCLDHLHRLFEPDRLLLVVWRPAELFSGQRAIDLIRAGRFKDVVDLYESALTYSPA